MSKKTQEHSEPETPLTDTGSVETHRKVDNEHDDRMFGGGVMAIFQPPKAGVGSIPVPKRWIDDPTCGESMTVGLTPDTDSGHALRVARALAGKTVSGKDSLNKPIKCIGITMEPFRSAEHVDEGGEVKGGTAKVGFHLHRADSAVPVFVANAQVKKDITAIIVRMGVPSPSHPVDVVCEAVKGTQTYRVICADLADDQ